jgi:transposase InsO family protein
MTTEQKIVKNKLGLSKLSETLGNVSQACRVMGYSRDSFYLFRELYETGGELVLPEISLKKRLLKNRVKEHVEKAVVDFACEKPAYGQLRVSKELKNHGVLISPGGVRAIWLRHNLETFRKRLKALEARMPQENLVLSAEQFRALEKSRLEKEASGEIETYHPGYLGAQDTYYVGTLKGVGRIYQQTFIDTYAKVALVKLYDRKNALVAADLLNDRVIPWYEEQGIRLLRILTDRGAEYCGNPENHEYQLYLAIEDIEHFKTRARSPQSNGICERFHRTIQNEFYAGTFRKKIYRGIEELQKDVDLWLKVYNEERPHTSKYCFGKTPMQTFLEAKYLADEKMFDKIQQQG